MPKFTAVMGKSGSNRIVSVEAETKDAARKEITRQLHRNSQHREIWKQWQESGAAIVSQELEETFDEASANALIRGRLAELLAELSTGTVTVPAAVYEAYGRAKAALKAFDQGILAEPTIIEVPRGPEPHRIVKLTREEWEAKQRER